MSVASVICRVLEPVFHEVHDAVSKAPVIDLGCGDGDFAMYFAQFGCDVDAVDHAETNYNQLRGVQLLADELRVSVEAHDIDLDRPFTLPRKHYGLALFLGTLYHIKNPFYVLVTISAHADWCLLSTRIAQCTPNNAVRIEDQPLAYLLGAREANNDPTNVWIFSFTGLTRLLERSGWIVAAHHRIGCSIDSDPVRGDKDERVFLMLKSRTRHSGLYVRPLEGWHAIEEDRFRWTMKEFALEVTVPGPSQEFALRFSVPEAVATCGIHVSCCIANEPVGSITCTNPGTLEFRGRFPFEATTYRLDFKVDSPFKAEGDPRELGICVPLLDHSNGYGNRIPFRVS